MEFITASELYALAQVIMVDLVLAGDNAIVVGMVAASLPAEQRRKVIVIGIVAATVLRIAFALITVQLLQIIGLMLAGGLLLLWVGWKLWREIESRRSGGIEQSTLTSAGHGPDRRFSRAVFQIILADVSMSLDNVLAVAGAAREHTWVLVVGLVLSVAFMALAATLIARLLHKHHWIAYVGLLVILYVALSMIWQGAGEVWAATIE